MNYNELLARGQPELRQLAAKYGIKTHHKHTAETIAKLIVEHIAKPPVQPVESMKHVAELAVTPNVVHSEEQVRETIKAYAGKDGFFLNFPGDDTVIMRYKGAEESIHLSAALRVIKMKADSVSKGARRMITVKNSDGNDVMMT